MNYLLFLIKLCGLLKINVQLFLCGKGKAPTKPTEFVTRFPLDEYNTAPQDGITHYIPRRGIQGTGTLPLLPAYVWENQLSPNPL